MRFSSSLVSVSVLLLCLGCAPISEVMRSDLESSQYTDVIERGEAWLKDASLERQATQEGRSVHRFVAEAYLGLAIARGHLSDFETFRTRYEKFSAYEDLLTTAYEASAKVALTRKVGTSPSWSSFEWFEARYGQSAVIGQARARILTAELGRLSANPTIEGYKALRTRFADWVEFKSHREGLLEAEAGFYAKTLLVSGAPLDAYRTYALTYPDHMSPEIVNQVSTLELAQAAELDDLDGWKALEGRYLTDWATSLKTETQSGVLSMKIRAAVQTNTQHAFDILNTAYVGRSSRLVSEIAKAECSWALGQIKALFEMRQAMQRDKALHLLTLMSRDGGCRTQVSDSAEDLSKVAAGGDLWANRILRRLNVVESSTPPAPLSRLQEAESFWGIARDSNRALNLRDMLDWYPDLRLGEAAEGKLVAVKSAERRGSDRIKPKVHASQSGRRGRHVSLMNLVDQFHGPVALSVNNLKLVDATGEGARVKLNSVKPVGQSYLWFTGQLLNADDRAEFRAQLMKFKRYYSLYNTAISTGVITQRGRRVRWQSIKQTDRLLDSLSKEKSRIPLASFSKVSKALERRSIASNIFHLAPAQGTQFGGEDCLLLAGTAREACQQSTLETMALQPLTSASQQRGLLSKAEGSESIWSKAFGEFGVRITPLSGFESLGLRVARSSMVKTRGVKGADPAAAKMAWQPEFVWHWGEAAHSPKTTTDTQIVAAVPTTGSDTLMPWHDLSGATVRRFDNPLGEVAVVTLKETAERRIYVRIEGREWVMGKTLPVAADDDLKHATLINCEGLEVVRVLWRNGEVSDWQLTNAQWLKRVTVQRLTTGQTVTDSFTARLLGIKGRSRVLIAADTTEGVWRSIDAGKSWRHAHSGRRFEQVGQYHDGSPMICARVVLLDSNLKGIECSQDDGLSWQRFLSTVKPINLMRLNGELVVEYDGMNLRLGRLIDEGRIRAELLFVGKSKRLSQTGDWFGEKLSARVKAAGDRLLVSRHLKSSQSDAEGQSDEAFNTPLSMTRASPHLFVRPTIARSATPMWTYAIIGQLAQSRNRP